MSNVRNYQHRRGTIMVAIAAVLFALNGTAARLVLDVGLSAPRLTQIRSVGALFFIAIYVLMKNAKSLKISKKDVPFLAVYGIAGFAFVQYFYFVAITKLGVGIGLLFEFTAPVWIVLYVRFFRHEAVKKRMYAALACTVSGLVLISQLWSNTKLEPIGIACGLIASVSLAIYFLLGDKGVHKRDTLSLVTWGFIFATIFWAIFQPIWNFPAKVLNTNLDLGGPFAGSSVSGWWVILFIVLLGTIAPFLLTIGALRYTSPARVGLIGTLEPVLAGAFAWWWLGESLSLVQIGGAVVVLCGILLAETSR
ncbi:MAG: hypothetical protein EBU43_07300 [Actinobacteria bacterium]|uniref:Unannotated protein n=1 Tax=freshwater metagenome TaxID=449393 RepID=A0A6J7BA36_9ZZZZ|nr:EamA family transporter [Actinomycetota bacterium]MSY88275.1 EamA family transporter [Actinomycetota bacterium]MTA50658.1 EamA family transporter [Actinomycetota bacterium]NBP92124.1 hypothetical protein [Actinomycetota bacterium]